MKHALVAAGAAPLFFVDGVPVPRARFLGDVARLAPKLGDAPVVNLCESRYAFAVALGAALRAGVACLLPPSGAIEVVRRIAQAGGARAALCERAKLAAGLDWVEAPARPGDADGDNLDIDDAQVAAIAYTSGSSGAPQPHAKTWGELVRTAQLASARFFDGPVNVAGTVPAQHMYGLETTVILALAGAHAAASERPFFPADVAAVLASLPEPRVLVTTPVHLRALTGGGVELPKIARIISATAPLPVELAAAAEAFAQAPVFEIYGCTEAGSMATRRTVESPTWTLYPGMRLTADELGAVVHAQHLPQPVRIADQVETRNGVSFTLLGRNADTLKVAGKRIELSELTAQLLAIPGVDDGVVFQVDDSTSVVQRPAALVVAPTLSEAQVLDALAARVDPVFLPRPLRKVASLPRNEVGKLPRARLLELLRG